MRREEICLCLGIPLQHSCKPYIIRYIYFLASGHGSSIERSLFTPEGKLGDVDLNYSVSVFDVKIGGVLRFT